MRSLLHENRSLAFLIAALVVVGAGCSALTSSASSAGMAGLRATMVAEEAIQIGDKERARSSVLAASEDAALVIGVATEPRAGVPGLKRTQTGVMIDFEGGRVETSSIGGIGAQSGWTKNSKGRWFARSRTPGASERADSLWRMGENRQLIKIHDFQGLIELQSSSTGVFALETTRSGAVNLFGVADDGSLEALATVEVAGEVARRAAIWVGGPQAGRFVVRDETRDPSPDGSVNTSRTIVRTYGPDGALLGESTGPGFRSVYVGSGPPLVTAGVGHFLALGAPLPAALERELGPRGPVRWGLFKAGDGTMVRTLDERPEMKTRGSRIRPAGVWPASGGRPERLVMLHSKGTEFDDQPGTVIVVEDLLTGGNRVVVEGGPRTAADGGWRFTEIDGRRAFVWLPRMERDEEAKVRLLWEDADTPVEIALPGQTSRFSWAVVGRHVVTANDGKYRVFRLE